MQLISPPPLVFEAKDSTMELYITRSLSLPSTKSPLCGKFQENYSSLNSRRYVSQKQYRSKPIFKFADFISGQYIRISASCTLLFKSLKSLITKSEIHFFNIKNESKTNSNLLPNSTPTPPVVRSNKLASENALITQENHWSSYSLLLLFLNAFNSW